MEAILHIMNIALDHTFLILHQLSPDIKTTAVRSSCLGFLRLRSTADSLPINREATCIDVTEIWFPE